MIKDLLIPATNAVIYLKNGKRKYGILIENDNDYNTFYKFIAHEKTGDNNNYEDCIEIVATELIEAIDINLK